MLPVDRHLEQHDAERDDQRRLDEADDDVGRDLAQHDLERLDRHGEQALHGAALHLARDGQRGEDQHGHGEDGAEQARHDVEAGDGGRIVAAVLADLEGGGLLGWSRAGRGRAPARCARCLPARRAPCRRRPDRWRRPPPAAPAGRRAARCARSRRGSRRRTARRPSGSSWSISASERASLRDREVGGVAERGEDRAARGRSPRAPARPSAGGAAWC